jgi:hypothetical protein
MPAPPLGGRHDVGREPEGQAVDTDQVQAQGQSAGGNGDDLALVGLVDLHLDPDLGSPVRPWLGGGIGAACVALDTGDDARSRATTSPGPSPGTSPPAWPTTSPRT